MPTIGETLRETREKRKINIDVAAKAVKVKTEVLHQIEENDFSRFAAPIYARGIIRLYATYLGLEPETIVGEYNKLHPAEPLHKPVDELPREEREQVLERRRAVVISTVSKSSEISPKGIAGLVVAVIFLGVMIWIISSGGKSKSESPPPVAPQLAPSPSPVPEPTPAPAPEAVPIDPARPPAAGAPSTNAVATVPAPASAPAPAPAPRPASAQPRPIPAEAVDVRTGSAD